MKKIAIYCVNYNSYSSRSDYHTNHPRLLMLSGDEQEVKIAIQQSQIARDIHNAIIKEADNICKLREQGKDVELHVAGPHDNPIGYAIDGYHFYGDLSHDKVAELYNKCDIFCMPSFFEPYGLVFVEAMVFGLPCIGRNCYEMPYFIDNGETGLLLEKDDARQLASLMEQLLGGRKYKENVLSKRDFYLKEYSWDTVARRIQNVIEREAGVVLKKSSPQGAVPAGPGLT